MSALTYDANSGVVLRVIASSWNHLTMRFTFGVDIFFVLSGFLITSILLKARGCTNYFRVFYARRSLRILPLYYVAVAAAMIALQPPFRTQFWFWINASNFISCYEPSIVLPLTHFWTLAVEEQFYLLWPVLVLFISKRALKILCLIMAPLQYALRSLPSVQHLDYLYSNFSYRLTPFHSEGLFLGAWLALWLSDRIVLPTDVKWVRVGLTVSLAWVGVIVWPFQDGHPMLIRMTYAAISSLTVCVIALVVLQPHGWVARALSWKPLALVGRYSFCMYIVHQPLIFQLRRLTPHFFQEHRWGFPLMYAEMFLLTFVIAALSWRLLEEPILSLKRFFMYQTAKTPQDQVA